MVTKPISATRSNGRASAQRIVFGKKFAILEKDGAQLAAAISRACETQGFIYYIILQRRNSNFALCVINRNNNQREQA